MRTLSLSVAFISMFAAGAANAQAQYSPQPVVAPVATTTTTTTETMPSYGVPRTVGSMTQQRGEVIDSIGGGAIPALPLMMQSVNGINYMTGGIGDEELAALKQKQADYNLQILFTARDGGYISDVSLTVTDAAGKSEGFSNVGPYFYAAMQPGKYQLQATTPEQSVIKSVFVTVPQSGAAKQQLRFSE